MATALRLQDIII